MSLKNINQALNLKQSQNYDDQLDLANAQALGGNGEVDFNMLRTCMRVIHGGPAWNQPPPVSIKDLAETTQATKKVAFYWSGFINVTVPISQNWVLLTSAQAPAEVLAIDSDTSGAIVALLPGQSGMTHHLTEAANAGNLVEIRAAGTNTEILTSGGQRIYGLLQVDNTSTDGNAFSDFGPDSAQLSFVYRDPATEAFIAAPVADIQNTVIEYAYQRRENFVDLPENYVTAIRDFSKVTAVGTVIVNDAQDAFNPVFNGQTVFTLLQTPAVGGVVDAFVNGVKLDPTEFTNVGTTFTFLELEYPLATTDRLVVRYRV